MVLYTFEQYLELHQKYIGLEHKNLDGLVISQGQMGPCFFWGRMGTTILWELQGEGADTHCIVTRMPSC